MVISASQQNWEHAFPDPGKFCEFQQEIPKQTDIRHVGLTFTRKGFTLHHPRAGYPIYSVAKTWGWSMDVYGIGFTVN